jgi:hypothetical protein
MIMIRRKSMKKLFSPIIIMLALLYVHAHNIYAATYNLTPTDDAYVEVLQPDNNFGSSTRLATNFNFPSHIQFTYLKFDLSSIPSGEVINGAILNLYQVAGAGVGEAPVNAYRVPADNWTEGSVTWNNRPAFDVVFGTGADGHSHLGWSQWDLLGTGKWVTTVDRSDGLLSIMLAETPGGDTARQWCSKESDSSNCSALGATGTPFLQVTTTPRQTFHDVPFDYWAYSYIETLAANGVTNGCGPSIYCPEDSVTRAQMALFLERSMRGGDFQPDPAVGNIFLDVQADYWAGGWIELLYSDGITTGCGVAIYCPEEAVTREQMAVFLLRAKNGPDYVPPTPTGIFVDVPLTHWAAGWIEQLYAEGITLGCGPDIYCPSDAVTRAQMAVFLVRTFELL